MLPMAKGSPFGRRPKPSECFLLPVAGRNPRESCHSLLVAASNHDIWEGEKERSREMSNNSFRISLAGCTT